MQSQYSLSLIFYFLLFLSKHSSPSTYSNYDKWPIESHLNLASKCRTALLIMFEVLMVSSNQAIFLWLLHALSSSFLFYNLKIANARGIKPSDTAADIKKAYRKAALKHHPDKV